MQNKELKIGFLVGFGAWLGGFLIANLLQIMQIDTSILWKILAYPLAFFTAFFWKIFNVSVIPQNNFLIIIMFLISAIMWGIVGLFVGYVFSKVKNKGAK